MRSLLALQDFDHSEAEHDTREEWRKSGYDEGYAKAMSDIEQGKTEAIVSVARSISDLSFKVAELRSELTQEYSDVLAKAVDALLPPLKSALFISHIHEAIEGTFKELGQQKLVVEIGADLGSETVASLNRQGAGVEVVTSARLKSGEAIIIHPERELFIDFETAFEAVRDALSPLIPQSTERKSA